MRDGRIGAPTTSPEVAVVAWQAGWCNDQMVEAWRALGIAATRVYPAAASGRLRPDDIALNRLDVAITLDGLQPGTVVLERLERRGVRIVNRPVAMRAAHDKLETASRLRSAGLAHPATVAVPANGDDLELTPPIVLKPRFGSWGIDVTLCRTQRQVASGLRRLRSRRWFAKGGAIAQQYLEHRSDLRLVIAGRRLVGAIERRPPAGDWRTNFSLGGTRHPVTPPSDAVAVAMAGAETVGADLIGVDLIAGSHGFVIIELNGAVDFDALYSLPGRDVWRDVADALSLPAGTHPRLAPAGLHGGRR